VSRCPNLVPTEADRLAGVVKNSSSTFQVHVSHRQTYLQKQDYYDSLADFWTEWYNMYRKADFPRLIVRFEDTLFHAETVMEKIGECVGHSMKKPHRYFLEAAKESGKSRDLVNALSKYGSSRGRLSGLARSDFDYAQKALDPEMMSILHYRQPEQFPC